MVSHGELPHKQSGVLTNESEESYLITEEIGIQGGRVESICVVIVTWFKRFHARHVAWW